MQKTEPDIISNKFLASTYHVYVHRLHFEGLSCLEKCCCYRPLCHYEYLCNDNPNYKRHKESKLNEVFR